MTTHYSLPPTPSGKVILSGIQPSGTLHIGNYLGALKQWVALQDNNTAYYCIVDEHAITVEYDPKELPDRVLNAAAIYLAVGLDPNKATIFVQSHIPAHTELSWLLGTITPFGDLTRMTQFKDKALRQGTGTAVEVSPEGQITYPTLPGVSVGLFAYPVLMAADILLYQADLVPVGEDQKQHIELTRDIAERFNNRFGETFKIPATYIPEQTARIMSLTDPTRKMSKSDGEKSYVALTDEPDSIRKKIMRAVTDTAPVFKFDDGGFPADLSAVALAEVEASAKAGPAVKNLLCIYQALSEEEPAAIEQKFSGSGYKEFKEALAELLIEKLTPIREKYTELRQDEKHLKDILEAGREKAVVVANKTLHEVKVKMGLL